MLACKCLGDQPMELGVAPANPPASFLIRSAARDAIAAPEGPFTSAFRTLATESMRPGLQGFTSLYGALVVFCVLLAPSASPSHLKMAPETDLKESR